MRIRGGERQALDELFETLTLIQTEKMGHVPIVLFGREFWESAIDFEFLVDEGVIAPDDVKLFSYVETAEQAWDTISRHFESSSNAEEGDASNLKE